ncbi:MAG TPA: HDOD domain-containing protein [Methylomirabilota bacterium]|nr:HDOD domain-containing protein [Methylomirabilota bacterium]
MSETVAAGAPANPASTFVAKTDILERTRLIPQMNQELAKDEPTFDDVLAQLRRDEGLAARVLAIANSAWFAGRLKVDTLEVAFGRMGSQDFYRAVLAAVLRGNLGEGTEQNRWWQHADVTSGCCQMAAQLVAEPLLEKAWLTGLLHDCAVPLMARTVPDYSYLCEEALTYSPTIVATEQDCNQLDHCEVGAALLAAWRFPASFATAVRRHHTTLLAPVPDDEGVQLLALLLLAKRVCDPRELDKPVFAERDEAILLGDIATTLGLHPDRMREAVAELRRLYRLRLKHA